MSRHRSLDRPIDRSLHRLHRLSALALACAATVAQAQTAEPATKTLDTVVVTGQAAGLRSALDKQRAAQAIISVVHADGIGQLPDINAAEALARVPGVSVERDQGEGRFVRVRGLGPDMNAVSVNGTLVPSAEADRRAVGLDVVPAGLIRSLEVSKTLTPDQDANSLGGSIAVNTLSAFDQPGRFMTLSVGANHASLTGRSKPAGALIWSDRLLDNRLGVAVALSTDARAFGSDNVETGGAWDLDGAAPALTKLERRSYTITRERQGGAVNLDLRPDASQRYDLRMFTSRFTDDEVRQAQTLEFTAPLAEGQSGSAKAARALKARREISRIDSLSLGGERRFGAGNDWQLQARVGAGRASEDKPDTLSGATFKNATTISGVSFTDSKRPLVEGPASLAGADGFALDKIKLEKSRAIDREHNARVDLLHDLDAAGFDVELKGGLKASRRHKDNAVDVWSYAAKTMVKAPYSVPAARLAMNGYLTGGAARYPWGALGPELDAAAIRALVAPLPAAPFAVATDSSVGDYRIEEDSDAGYLQAKLERDGLQIVTGLRHETLETRSRGQGVRDGQVAPIEVATRSRHWLPALLLRQNVGADWLLRAAYTQSVVRPTFGQLSPGLLVEDDSAEFGNPALRPLRSRNLDLGVEHQLGRDGTVSAYLFHKRIRDFVYQTDLAGQGPWAGFDAAVTYANGEAAKVSGLELSYAQALRGLPAPWNGLVVGANATFVDSSALIGGWRNDQWQQRRLALPSQSDRSVNLSLGWEGRGFSARVALNHKSAYLLEVGDVFDARKDSWVDAQSQVDLSVRWDINARLQLSVDALNLNDNPYYVYAGRRALNAQYEQYGRSFKLGLKWTVF